MTPSAQKANAYLRTKVLTAAPEELRLMLLEGAVRFATQGRDGLARKDFEASFNGFTQARDIVLELINSVRPEIDPQLCAKVQAVFTFIYKELVSASFEKSVERADAAIKLLEYERDTWAMLIQKLAAERASSSPSPSEPAAAEQTPQHSARLPLSIEG